MPSESLIACHRLMKDQQLTISVAESATAGRLSAEFSLIPECGKILKGGIVCYDAGIKQDILGVPAELVQKFTPESAEVTRELAERLSYLIKADIQIAITGLTMPGGSETPEKPVGTIFIHALVLGKSIPVREVYEGSAEDIVLQAIDRVAQLIIGELSSRP